MPLDFVETDKAPAPVEFFATNTKVGDVKDKRLTLTMVEKYLEANVLIFDPKLLKELFDEADFKGEGSLDMRALAAAVSGRYPKRKLTREWRELVALLLGMPELSLTEDVVNQKVAKNGNFNADSAWSQEPTPLPPIRAKRTKSTDTKAASALAPLDTNAEAEIPCSSSSASRHLDRGLGHAHCSSSRRSDRDPMAEHIGAGSIHAKEGQSSLPEGGDHDHGEAGHAAHRSNATPDCMEQSMYQSLMGGAISGLYKSSQQVLQPISLRGNATSTSSPRHALASPSKLNSSLDTSPWTVSPGKQLRAWCAVLPPTGISLSASELQTLKSSIHRGGSGHSKPRYITTTHASLSTSSLDFKRTLGLSLPDLLPLNRVEPTRPTTLKFGADFIETGDYASRCRSMPGAWFHSHPAAPSAVRQATKYPWGEWA